MAAAEFDAFAGSYDEDLARGLSLTGEGKLYYARRRLQWLARRLRSLGAVTRRVMDFGCGTGTSLPLIRELLGAELVVGIDPSPASLAEARTDHGGPGVELALPSERPGDASFDLVFTNGVLHHVAPAERPSVLDYVAASLRPGGYFACWENNPLNPGTRWIMRRVAFDRDAIMLRAGELERRMRDAGLVVLATDYLFVFPDSFARPGRWSRGWRAGPSAASTRCSPGRRRGDRPGPGPDPPVGSRVGQPSGSLGGGVDHGGRLLVALGLARPAPVGV